MSVARIPADEVARLAALRSYDLLDQPSEAAIDALVRVAARVCEMPISLVSLIDADRQWYLSQIGLEVRQTSREVAFCSHAILTPAMTIVEDALDDPRFVDNPLVVGDPHIRFYAGTPLIDSAGFALGTLCVIDRVPRRLTALQVDILGDLTVAVLKLLEARRLEQARRLASVVAQAATVELAQVLDIAPTGIVKLDQAGTIRFANAMMHQEFGYQAGALIGQPLQLLVPERGHDQLHQVLAASLADPTPRPMGHGGELVVRRRDGTEFPVELARRTIEAADGRELLVAMIDVTARREAQALRDRLSTQERLITTGTLAAGVGHEINNPLTYIMASLDFALEQLAQVTGPSPSTRMREVIEALGEGREGAERIRRIVRGLRTFARRETVVGAVDVGDAAEIAIDMALHDLRQRATVRRDLQPVPPVRADAGQLSQVIVNLLVNAAQSFAHGDPDVNLVTIGAAPTADGRVAITVADNGPGIAPEVLPRIYDPFFTTKPVGVGTGLGLAICHNIVIGLGGELACETRLGEGTTFRVTLARADPEAAAPAAAAPAASAERRGSVMLIDDEPFVLTTMARLLRDGHDVVTLSDPRDAALILLDVGRDFDLVVCDLMMPHLTGMELFARVQAARPALADRFVFMTGGATVPAVQAFLDQVSNERVEKPLSSPHLRGLARRMVDRGRPAR